MIALIISMVTAVVFMFVSITVYLFLIVLGIFIMWYMFTDHQGRRIRKKQKKYQ